MAKLTDRELYHLGNTSGISNVGCYGDSLSPRIPYLPSGDSRPFEIHVSQRDIGSFARKREAGSMSDPARPTGNKHAFTIESHVGTSNHRCRKCRILYG